MPLWGDPHDMGNPFVSSLVDGIKEDSNNIEFVFPYDFLYSDACENVDIIHIMWPHVFGAEDRHLDYEKFDARLKYLKGKGVKVVSTCHNYVPHYSANEQLIKAYEIVYENSDLIIHLGRNSAREFENKYPQTPQILIPHHIYDKIYLESPPKKECIRKLGLNSYCRYIICLGAFRSDEERNLLLNLGEKLRFSNVFIIAPSFTTTKFEGTNIWERLNNKISKVKLKYHSHIISADCYVCDADIPYYYGASEVSLIQRLHILNSGNVPMGLFFGNVVVGPNVGNVGELLKDTGNVVFGPDGTDVYKAVMQALALANTDRGKINREYALEHLSTDKVVKRHIEVYTSLLK